MNDRLERLENNHGLKNTWIVLLSLTGEDGLCGPDAAHVDSSLYLDVALISPPGTPGVLH